MLADYDDFTGEFCENKRGDVHVCNGASIAIILDISSSVIRFLNVLPGCIPACRFLICPIQSC